MNKKILIFLGLLIFLNLGQVEGRRRGVIISSGQVVTGTWQYTRPITIYNSAGTVTDYQVQILLTTAVLGNPYNNFTSSDGSEIRIKNVDRTIPLDFWIENFSRTGTSTIWVKIPNLITGTTTIYLDYSNPIVVPSLSNGSNTFIFFDDFDSNLDKWTLLPGKGTINIVENELRIYASAVLGVNPVLRTISTFDPPDRSFECKLRFTTLPTGRQYGFNLTDGTRRMYWLGANDGGGVSDYYLDVDGGAYEFEWDVGTWQTGVSYRLTSSHATLYNYAARNGISTTYTTMTFGPNLSLPIQLGDWGWNTSDTNAVDLYIDWVFVRRFILTPPTVVIGAEQNL